MAAPIRVLHIVEAFGVGGGVETGIANLIDRLDPSRYEHILCGIFRVGELTDRYPADRVRIVSLGQRGRRLALQIRPITEAIRQTRPDIVHSRNWGALEAVLAARWARSCSIIHSEHGVENDPAAEPYRRRYFRRLVFGLADRIFSVSYQLQELLAQRTGFPAAKIRVIHNGVDTAKFRFDAVQRQQRRTELNLASDDFCIGCVGRLSPIKDYPTILRAAEILSASCLSWRLVIAGEGTERTHLQEFVRSRPSLADRVHFIGSNDNIAGLLSAMDAYVLSSICEGISNSLLEAMATRLPVVATDTGGNPEVIVGSQSGLLFPVGDAQALAARLARLHQDIALREELGSGALRRVNCNFALDGMVRKYDEMYTSLAEHRAADRTGTEKALCRTES